MARSNTGGTRGFIRGKVASDLYQVTRTSTGKKVQLVRAVEESRINNNTIAQAMARMQMAMCMGSLSQFKAIVDHSFEGIPYGQLSIAHFVKVNIPLLQADCKANWDGNSHFDYAGKGDLFIRVGDWLLSSGSLTLPSCVKITDTGFSKYKPIMNFVIGRANATYGDLRQALGVAAGDYFTIIAFWQNWGDNLNKTFAYYRFYLAPMGDEVVITAGNCAQMFTYDGTMQPSVNYNAATGTISYTFSDPEPRRNRMCVSQALIMSKWDGKVWRRNTARFAPMPSLEGEYGEYVPPIDVFQSWFPDYDPDESPDYPLT